MDERKTTSRIYLYVLYFQLVCIVILIIMGCNLNLYYVLYF
jgi:hypothetical protein